jgi:hypothetical protein
VATQKTAALRDEELAKKVLTFAAPGFFYTLV